MVSILVLFNILEIETQSLLQTETDQLRSMTTSDDWEGKLSNSIPVTFQKIEDVSGVA